MTELSSPPLPGSRLLAVFAKHWQPGKVKTRLAAKIGHAKAADVQKALLRATLARLQGSSEQGVLAFTPPHEEAAFRAIAIDWNLQPQAAGDLGDRMQAFFASSLTRAERIVLIGSDSPDLPQKFIDEAFSVLAEQDVVLGPAGDGGYYLVGVARRLPPIFADIPWSTAEVWPRTVERLRRAGIEFHTLPPWYDVDDEASLSRLRGNLQQTRTGDDHLAHLENRLDEILSKTTE
jgi:rSAM/selenodomain-associated transferase 1